MIAISHAASNGEGSVNTARISTPHLSINTGVIEIAIGAWYKFDARRGLFAWDVAIVIEVGLHHLCRDDEHVQ